MQAPRKLSHPKTKESAPSRIRVLSYNIHQGLTIFNREISFAVLKEAILSLRADVVLLQEVAGIHGDPKRKKSATHETTPFQLEALADAIWPYTAYQKNSVFTGGFHGNAILSRFPIKNASHFDISVKGMIRRGLLHAEVDVPHVNGGLHVIGTHLGLLQVERRRQVRQVCQYIQKNVGPKTPLLMAGDFNDWREKVSPRLRKAVKLKEAFLEQDSKHARTFPSRFPVLRLDRIYYRGAELHKATRVLGRPWLFLSDHLPLIAEFELKD